MSDAIVNITLIAGVITFMIGNAYFIYTDNRIKEYEKVIDRLIADSKKREEIYMKIIQKVSNGEPIACDINLGKSSLS